MKETDLALFNQQCMTVFKSLSDLKKEQDRLADIEKKAKDDITKAMEKYGITSVANSYLTISMVAPSESTTLDVKKLAEKEPELYNELMEDYTKATKKSGYLRFTVK